jgi:hypothetical protein
VLTVSVTPKDGSFIHLPPSVTISDLLVSVRFNDSNCQSSQTTSLPLYYHLHVFANGGSSQPTLVLPVNVCDVRKNDVVSFTLNNLHLGTHALFMHLKIESDQRIDWSGMVYYEVVPHILIEATYDPLSSSLYRHSPPPLPSPASMNTPKLQIVVVGTSTMDGQKIIWLEQMVRLEKSVDFTFICYVCEINDEGEFLKELEKLDHVAVLLYPGFDVDNRLGLSDDFPHNVIRILRQNMKRFGRYYFFFYIHLKLIIYFNICYFWLFFKEQYVKK